jgi:Tfp pilus assembly protein FimT
MSARCAAFTLLEICLTLLIGLVLITLAVPSVSGLLAEQRLHETWDRFEQLVNTARLQSIKEQQPYRLVWEKNRVVVEAASAKPGESKEKSSLTMEDSENYELIRTAALINPAPQEWTFWPNGACEPVVIRYHGRSGRWRVRFDALSSRGTFEQSETL